MRRAPRLGALAAALASTAALALASPLVAAPAPQPTPASQPSPAAPSQTQEGSGGAPSFTFPRMDLRVTTTDGERESSTALQILLLLTVLSLAPAAIVMLTSFTRIVIVLSLIRSAIGVPSIPPNQVVVGLALFLTFFTMAPALHDINEKAAQPYLRKEITQAEALRRAVGPLRGFMLKQTRERDLALFVSMSGQTRPRTPDDVPTYVVIPAFAVSELRTAFIMGSLVFIPFLIVDLVVSSTLMSMGMLMLPPALISLPFKLLLFVLVDGWHLITRALVLSFR